jgi:hypothetical protein
MNNPQELKKLIIKQLVEKGDYDKVLSHLGSEEKENSLTKLIKPMSAVADILTENAKGAFMEDLEKRLDEATTKGNEELRKDLEEAHATLKTELQEAVNTNRNELSSDILTRVTEAQERLQETLARYADSIVTQKADSMFSDLGELAKLSEGEIQEIVDEAALSVETQIASVIGDYISETGITTSQITDFDEAVKRLLPTAQQVTWESIVGRPDISQGGTNTNIVRALIAEALANFSGGGLPNGGTTGQALIKQSNADGDADWQSLPGGGDMLAATYDPANKAEQVLTISDATDFATAAQGALADTASQPGHTHVAADVTDFDAEVSNNTDVAANTAARHDAVTLAGSPNYITIAGQVITRALINLASHVTGKLPFANLADGTAHSVVGRSGSGSGDVGNISAGNDTILSRSGSGNVTFNNASTVRTILNVADGANNYVHPNHSGDVTSTGDGATVIANNAVTLAKVQTIATDSILGRASASTGNVEVLTALPFAFTGDVTRPIDSNVQTIANDAVTYAKMQNVSANSVLARSAATSGDVGEVALAASQLLGRGATGDVAAITLGTNLSMSGTTLNATGGSGGTNINTIYIDQAGGTSDTYGVLAGTRNGSNKVFTVSQGAYATGTLKVWRNGQLMTQGTGEDFVETTPASGTFTFDVAPASTDEITVEYQEVTTDPSDLAFKSTAMGVIVHGATAGTARPTGYAVVTWIGSVEPTNAINDDIWYSTV